jgi:signal transduction histidine kinase
MTSTEISSSGRAVLVPFPGAVRRLGLPLGSSRFWLAQVGVLLVAFLDEIVLDVMRFLPPLEIPRSTVSALLLVPVIYAALNFGVRGAVGTALWATALMIPDWLFITGVTTANAWVEIGNLAILNGVAVIVGQRVDREGQARLRAEGALRASDEAEARYRAVVRVEVTEEEQRAREQRAYAAHLVTVQEDERRTLAQDLHDDPVQTLTYLVRMLERLSEDPRLPPELAPLVLRDGELASEVVDALRTVIHGLRPPVLDDFGVAAALRQLVAEVRNRHGISIRLQVSGDPVRLSDRCELAVYRVAQEALSNVVRHARATHVRVALHFGEQVVLTVTDDGRGIAASGVTAGRSGGGLGLLGMRERVSLVGGSLEVEDRTPHGTLVRATVTGSPTGS